MDGFSYNGVHCEELGLTYVQNVVDRLQSVPDFKPVTKTVTAHPGAYWYENTVSQRDFTLECVYEDLTTAELEEILRWVDRDSKGMLIFDDRPFVYYLVRPSKPPSGKRYSEHPACVNGEMVTSGTFTFTFTGYDPFGYLSEMTSDNDENIEKTCGAINQAMMPTLTTSLGVTQLVYNPGTEKCPARITIEGSAPNGLKINNYTTGDVCTITSLPENTALVIDSATGMVSKASDHLAAFSYHNDGYITLASCVPYARDIDISWTNGSNAISSTDGKFIKAYVGNYVYIGDEWLKILQVSNKYSAVVSKNVTAETASGKTMLTRMNEIYISGTGASISSIQFDYTPRVR